MLRAVGVNTNSPIQNVWAAQQISPKSILTFECGDGETIYTSQFTQGSIMAQYF